MYSEVRFSSFKICISSEKLILYVPCGFPFLPYEPGSPYICCNQKCIRQSAEKSARGRRLLELTDGFGIHLAPEASIWRETEFGQLLQGLLLYLFSHNHRLSRRNQITDTSLSKK